MTEEEKNKISEINKEIYFNNKICGDRKPYFFGYIYPKYMDEFKRHRNNYKKMCEMMYSCKIYDLAKKKDKTEEEKTFIQRYYKYMPLLTNNCTMNILANYIEDIEFDNRWKRKPGIFDYHNLMSKDYDLSDNKLYNNVRKTISEFNKKYNMIIGEKKLLEMSDDIVLEKEDIENYSQELSFLIQEYESKILSLCSDARKVTDYLVDIYYKYYKNKSKFLIWGEFGEYILENVKSKSNSVCFPVLDENGEEYLGKKYSLKEVLL